MQAEGGCIGCFAERQETTSDLDDEGALGMSGERIGERGTGRAYMMSKHTNITPIFEPLIPTSLSSER